MKEIHIWISIGFCNAYFKLGFGEEKNSFKFISKLFPFSGRGIVHCFRFRMILGKNKAILTKKIFHVVLEDCER